MDLHQFLIVAFKNEEDAVAILPETYLINNKLCFWPPYTSQGKVNKAFKECEAPNENWPKHGIRVIKKIGQSHMYIMCLRHNLHYCQKIIIYCTKGIVIILYCSCNIDSIVIRVFLRGCILGSYNKAQCQLEKATITSDLQSDSESNTRLRPKRYLIVENLYFFVSTILWF